MKTMSQIKKEIKSDVLGVIGQYVKGNELNILVAYGDETLEFLENEMNVNLIINEDEISEVFKKTMFMYNPMEEIYIPDEIDYSFIKRKYGNAFLLEFSYMKKKVYSMVFCEYQYGFKVVTVEFNEENPMVYYGYGDLGLEMTENVLLFKCFDEILCRGALKSILENYILDINENENKVFIGVRDMKSISTNYELTKDNIDEFVLPEEIKNKINKE